MGGALGLLDMGAEQHTGIAACMATQTEGFCTEGQLLLWQETYTNDT